MSISSAFTYENFPEAHRQGFSCFSPRVVCSSQLKRMIEVLNVGMLKNTLFLALTVANVIFFCCFEIYGFFDLISSSNYKNKIRICLSP